MKGEHRTVVLRGDRVDPIVWATALGTGGVLAAIGVVCVVSRQQTAGVCTCCRRR